MKQIKLHVFWLIFLLFRLQVFSQINVTGTVTESGNNHPVLYATVYVNGTSNGTITNSAGQFSLQKVIPPCEIVVSHISYATEVIEIKLNSDTTLHIKLKPRDIELGTVEVIDKNRREENLLQFKLHFLGTDYWGKNASLENDSVLIFHREKISESEGRSFNSGLLAADSSSMLFVVNTKAPLLVNLPLLGYKLHINLIHYIELQTGNDKKYEFHILGYFYFQPDKKVSKRKTNRFERKRLEAYYNSDLHFCRSLINDQLKENGYSTRNKYFIIFRYINPETGLSEEEEFEFEKYIIRTDNEAKIVGLKNKNLYIEYFFRI